MTLLSAFSPNEIKMEMNMKKVILSLISATLLFGFGVKAELTVASATEKVMNNLDAEGLLDGLTDSEFNAIEKMVSVEVSNGLESGLNLSDGAQEAAFLSDIGKKIKSGLGKVVDFGKKAFNKAKDLAKKVASKVGPFVQKYGPKLVAAAKNMLPQLANLAGGIAKNMGVPEDVVAGIIGGLSKKEQQDLANDPDEATKLVADQIEGN